MTRKREHRDEVRVAADAYSSDSDDQHMSGVGPREKVRVAEARPICTSCEQCQLRKGKCDRGQPACGWCVANHKVCEYKERKKPGLRAGYGRNLEHRLDLVEERLEAQARALELLEHDRHLPQLTTTLVSSRPSPSPVGDRNSMSSNIAPPMYGAPRSRSQSHVFGTSWTESPQASLHENSFSDTHGGHLSPAVHDDQSSIAAPSSFSSDMHLPPSDMLFTLVNLYFLHVNTWFPLLDRPTTMERLFGPTPWTESERILLHAITATTIRLCHDVRLDDASRRRYFIRSKQKVLLYGMENFSVGGLRAMVIIALNYVGARNGGPGLNLIAWITRAAEQLGLNKEAYSAPVLPAYTSNCTLGVGVLPAPRDWIEDEGRRRLFWLIYILDRDATVATAFDFTLDEKNIDRKLPCKDEFYAQNKAVDTRWFQPADQSSYRPDDSNVLGTLSYTVELKGFFTKIHQFLKRPVDIGAAAEVEQWQHTYRKLEEMLHNWRQNLPAEFRSLEPIMTPGHNSPPVDCSWVLLQSTFYTVSIRLHSAAAYPSHKSSLFASSYSAAQTCYQEAENIVSLARHAVAHGLLPQLGPQFAYAVWVAARVLIVHGSTIEKQVSPAVSFLIDLLQQTGVLWPLAGRYGAILQRVMDDYREGQLSGGASGSHVASISSTVPILADMRRCAYDLDLLITSHHGGYGRPGRSSAAAAQAFAQPTQQLTPSTASSTRGWWPTSQAASASTATGQYPDATELDYLEAFDFFNYPRLPGNDAAATNTTGASFVPSLASNHLNIDQFTVDPRADWLTSPFG